MQELQIEWEMSNYPLWGMAYMSAQIGDISQHLNLHSTHSPLISLAHYLSLEGRTREEKDELEWESEEEGGEENQDCKG